MSNTKKAIEILERSNDGNDLSPGHLYLVQLAVNGNLNESGEDAFNNLYNEVATGTYVRPWFHNIEGLTRDHSGYVYWKGVCVEHYSYDDPIAEKAAAERLAARCLTLEAKNFPVNGRTATCNGIFAEAPAGTPWLQAMLNYYTAFADSDGKCKWLIVNLPNHNAVAISIVHGEIVLQYGLFDGLVSHGSYNLFHSLQNEGLKSCGDRLHSYSGFVSAMDEAGITPEAVARAIAAGLPAQLAH